MVRPLSGWARGNASWHGGLGMPRREPDDLRALGDQLDAARGNKVPEGGPPPSSLGIAFRFGTELGAAVFVGAGLGWLLDKFLHTSPIFLIVLFCLGAAAGIRNVFRAAKELNAQAASSQAPAVKDDDEEN
jgi:ATP synthase protein I